MDMTTRAYGCAVPVPPYALSTLDGCTDFLHVHRLLRLQDL